MKWLSLAFGGVIGTLARYVLLGLAHRAFGMRFPYGTLAVNLLGCFIIGLLTALGEEKIALSHEAKLFLVTGFCGAFTTFSALMLETAGLLEGDKAGLAFVNVLAHAVLGFLIFRAGLAVAKIF